MEVTADGLLLATGSFVCLSQLTKLYQKEKGRIHTINIFASGTIFIDTDFTAPGCNLVLGDSKLHVTEPATINLDGHNRADKIGTAPEGKGESPGENCLLGGNSLHAGHFIATALEAENLGHLTISSNGGNGGHGQNVGNGGNGSKGWDPELPSNSDESKPIGKENVDWILLDQKFDKRGAGGQPLFSWDYWYRLYGKKATDGQPGGDGGARGTGGSKGEIKFAILGVRNTGGGVPTRKNKNGQIGTGGKGGKGGEKAKHGVDWKVHYCLAQQGYAKSGNWTHEATYPGSDEYSKNGPSGRDGKNKKGVPEKEVVQDTLGLMATYINRFKAYSLRVASGCPIRRATLESLLDLISTSPSIYDMYDISTYLNEMMILESEFWNLHKYLNLKGYYTSIQKRITELPQKKPVLLDETVGKLVLSTVYATCQSKICSLAFDHQKEQRLIVHLKSFMKSAIGRVEKLETMDKSLAIKQFQKSYRAGIESKIIEARDLINQKVNPAIETLLRSLDTKLDDLVKEAIKKKETAVTDREKLLSDEKQMTTALLIKEALNILKIGSVLASFAGPMGKAVGEVANNVASIGEQFVIEPEVKRDKKIVVPKGVTDAISGLGDILNKVRHKKFEIIEEQLKEVNKELAKKPKDWSQLEVTINQIRKNLKEEKEKKIAEDDLEGGAAQKERLDTIEKDLKDALEDKKLSLEAEINRGEKDKEQVLAIVDKINKGVKLIGAFLELYNTYKGDLDKIEIIKNGLTQADTNILALKNYERDIYGTMYPLVRNMRNNVNAVTSSFSTKSQVALDVSKWETQKILTGVQGKLTKALEGYKAQEGVTACFNQLTEALNLLINIYDRLEHFQDQQRLGDYIANIGAPMDYTNLLVGTKFQNDFAALHLTMQSNLVLMEYENAMFAFRQWIFPFARTYYDKYNLPKNLKGVLDPESLHDLVVAASRQLRNARNNIVGSRDTITHRDDFAYSGTFTSGIKIGGPFYTWTFAHNREELKDLFNGEEITIFADVENIPPEIKDRKAIKFKHVELNFRLRGSEVSSEVKSELNDLMDYFFVNLIHTGTSYYDFENEIYVIGGHPIDLGYSIQKDQNGVPLSQSEQREKLSSSREPLLSPYAQWKVQLSVGNKNGKDGDGTEDLKDPLTRLQDFMKEYGQYFALELVGTGPYIFDRENQLANELVVNDYYQVLGAPQKLYEYRTRNLIIRILILHNIYPWCT